MANVDFSQVEIHDEFWSARQKINREVSLPAIWESYLKTHRFDATKCSYKKWKFWSKPPHVFYDSDIAKFIEAWAYHLGKERDEEVEKFIDDLIDSIAKNQRSDGYYNSHFLVTQKDKIFTYRWEHELYCLGHLIEAAIAYANATGKDKLLNIVEKYVCYVEERFLIKKDAAFTCPGHPEIELALIKLYDHTGKIKYLELARYFINVRGTIEGDKGLDKDNSDNPWRNGLYAQDHLPLREQRTAEGHSVRACYLYSGAADLAKIDGDVELWEALKAIYENIVDRRMYVSGGIGAMAWTEGFDKDFVLPNDLAYTESCAAIALIMFARRMSEIERNAKYADLIERVLYNGFLSGVSLSGDRFFYENPLEIDHKKRANSKARYPIDTRQKDFSCSCCPPNIARLISSIGSYIYSVDKDSVYIEQFISSTTDLNVDSNAISVSLDSHFPKNSNLNIKVQGLENKLLKVRYPAWATDFSASKNCYCEKGYLIFKMEEREEHVSVTFNVEPKVVASDERVLTNKGTAYVQYGQIIYCAEEIDNKDLTLYSFSSREKREIIKEWSTVYNAYVLNVPAIKEDKECYLKMIPYFAFANRGKSDMYVYINYKK